MMNKLFILDGLYKKKLYKQCFFFILLIIYATISDLEYWVLTESRIVGAMGRELLHFPLFLMNSLKLKPSLLFSDIVDFSLFLNYPFSQIF